MTRTAAHAHTDGYYSRSTVGARERGSQPGAAPADAAVPPRGRGAARQAATAGGPLPRRAAPRRAHAGRRAAAALCAVHARLAATGAGEGAHAGRGLHHHGPGGRRRAGREGRVRSHCRFRNRATEYVSKYCIKWMSSSTFDNATEPYAKRSARARRSSGSCGAGATATARSSCV